jgi:PAS domain S-box-containing protein
MSDTDSVRVLHVDDDSSFCELVGEFLEREGLTVATETDPRRVVERLERERIDCVVSDYDMPHLDGLSLLESVRERYPDLPYILFTGRGNEEVASDAISAGVSDYLQKDGSPEQYELLANRVRNYVRQYRIEREVESVRRRYELAGTVASDVIFEHDPADDETVYADGFEDVFGYDPDAAGGTDWWLDRVHPEDRDRVADRSADAVDAGESTVSLSYRFRSAGGEYRHVSEDRHVEYDEDGDLERIVGAFRDVTDQRRSEQRLDALHAATRRIIGASDPEAVARLVSGAAEDILDLPLNAVFFPEGDTLVPVAWTDRTEAELGAVPTFERGEAIAWEVYESGDPRRYGDVRDGENVYDETTAVRSELHAPIGDHGVFVAGSTTVDDFSATDFHLAQVLAANAEAALERLAVESPT